MLLVSTIFTIVLGGHSVGFLTEVPVERWLPEPGDALIIDTKANVGYLIHEDGVFTSFPAATGQLKTVHYIGRRYKAKTPDQEWIASTLEYKLYDRVTFGKTGRFLRLFHDGEQTPYGIHGHRDAEKMLAEDSRFRSMGCIIVSEETLDILERTFKVNEGAFTVLTTNGIGNGSILAAGQKEFSGIR